MDGLAEHCVDLVAQLVALERVPAVLVARAEKPAHRGVRVGRVRRDHGAISA